MSRAFLFVLAVGVLPGCFNPHYASPGFACSSDVSLGQGCPSSQVCVDSRCVDKGAAVGDLASSPEDLASSSTDQSGPHDLASTPVDMVVTHDFSTPSDLSVCVAKGGDCTYHNDSVCCSNYCVYSTNTCK